MLLLCLFRACKNVQAAMKRLTFAWWLVAWDHYTIGAVSLKQLSYQFALRYKASVIEVASLAAAEGLPESLPVVYDELKRWACARVWILICLFDHASEAGV